MSLASTLVSGDEVILTPEESRICAWVGRMRFENARRCHRNPGLGPSMSGPEHHIRGAHCEFAASLILNVKWRPTIGQVRPGDVGDFIEVRSAEQADGRLIVKPDDDDEAPFVLIVAEMKTLRFRAAGWLYGREAKRFPLVTQFGDPAHFVPQRELAELRLLKALIRSAGIGDLMEALK
jgi:hypothetical protein